MADVPSQVNYGQVVGHFVQFVADTTDPDNVPDEVPLSGTITLTPLTKIIRFASTNPPRLAVAQTVVCPVINGDIYPPTTKETDLATVPPGVWVIATDQPLGDPNLVQWQANFSFLGIQSQPNQVIFNVQSNTVCDLSVAYPVDPEPPAIEVVGREQVQECETIRDECQNYWGECRDYAVICDGDAQVCQSEATRAQNSANVLAQGYGVLVLSAAAPVPPGTPVNTVILRTAT